MPYSVTTSFVAGFSQALYDKLASESRQMKPHRALCVCTEHMLLELLDKFNIINIASG